PGPFLAVLELSGGGGGVGGLFEHRSSLLASQSYVSLVLQYLTDFSTTVAIGCKYFETAFSMLRDHPQVASDRVAVFGFSLGSSGYPRYHLTSDLYAQMCSMMERTGNGHLLTTVSYPGACHLIKPSYTPHFHSSTFLRLYTKNRVKVIMLWEGQYKWRRILDFL
ncbi:unnamed protein product, partial [Coregonus sp. 'balchen']